jgi:hypothetical protein
VRIHACALDHFDGKLKCLGGGDALVSTALTDSLPGKDVGRYNITEQTIIEVRKK